MDASLTDRPTAPPTPPPVVGRIARYLAVFFLWYLGVSMVISLGMVLRMELAALGMVLLLAALLLDRFLLAAPRERWVLLRVRPLRPVMLRWTLLAVPVLLMLAWALGEVWIRLVPVPVENFDPFQQLTQTATGRLVLAVLAVCIAPVLEEFFFRGLVQGTLERRLGPAGAILGSAALFAGVHFLPWVFPLHLLLGVAFGFVVYATRSIWAGVMLHAANNAAAVAGIGLRTERPEDLPTVWQTGATPEWWLALGGLALATALALRTGRGMLAAHRAARLRPSTAGQ